jgi:hypothetical protein
MKSIKIISKTEIGDKAIMMHYQETLKMSFIKKQMLKKTGFNQDITSKLPLVLSIWATPNSMFSMAKSKHIIEEIDTAMNLNQAENGKDYVIEVEE